MSAASDRVRGLHRDDVASRAGDPRREVVFVGLGSNAGERRATIGSALDRIAALVGVRVVRVSKLRETAPVGGPPQRAFVNAVAELETSLEPAQLLAELQRVEGALGRVREVRWGPRTIDIDVLLFGELVLETPDLVVPHPRLSERAFVLEPLAEIASERVHPGCGRTLGDLWIALSAAPAPVVAEAPVPGAKSAERCE